MKQFCTFYVAGFLFGIEVRLVKEVIRFQKMTPVPLARHEVRGLINLRGGIVTAIDLRTRLQLDQQEAAARPMNVVIYDGDDAVSLLVDEISDVLTLDEADFELPPNNLAGPPRELIHGVYKLEERLMMVLDCEKTIDIVSGASEPGITI